MKYKKILVNTLRDNSRISIAKLARKINISSTTLYFEYNKINNSIIKKNVTLLNFEKANYYVEWFFIKADTFSKKELKSIKNANNIYRTTNHYFLELVFNSKEQSHQFKEKLSRKRINYESSDLLSIKKIEGLRI